MVLEPLGDGVALLCLTGSPNTPVVETAADLVCHEAGTIKIRRVVIDLTRASRIETNVFQFKQHLDEAARAAGVSLQVDRLDFIVSSHAIARLLGNNECVDGVYVALPEKQTSLA